MASKRRLTKLRRQREQYAEKCRIAHLSQRGDERYGGIDFATLAILQQKIRAKESIVIERVSCTRSILLVSHEGQDYCVVYHRARAQILTFLPLDCREMQEYASRQANCEETHVHSPLHSRREDPRRDESDPVYSEPQESASEQG